MAEKTWEELVEYLRSQHEIAYESIAAKDCTERNADYYRGRLSMIADLISFHDDTTIPNSTELNDISSYTVPL